VCGKATDLVAFCSSSRGNGRPHLAARLGGLAFGSSWAHTRSFLPRRFFAGTRGLG
jgi:hypothetical protein